VNINIAQYCLASFSDSILSDLKILNMRKSIMLATFFVVISFVSSAQFSAGLDFAQPNWEGASLGYGVSVGYEYELSDNLGATAQVGYILMGVDDAFFNNYSMIPVQVGAKYYLDDKSSGLYAHAQAGIHSVSSTTPEIVIPGGGIIDDIVIPEETYTNSNTSFAIGAGYIVNENIDASVRYNVLTYDGFSVNYIGMRIGYTFGGGE
jgi:hypothetical protein